MRAIRSRGTTLAVVMGTVLGIGLLAPSAAAADSQRAMRWQWIRVNPLGDAESPRGVKHDPHPPTPQQAAAILNAAFTDLPWAVLLWLAMTTGLALWQARVARQQRAVAERRFLESRQFAGSLLGGLFHSGENGFAVLRRDSS